MENRKFDSVARVVSGLAMLLYPVMLMVGFAMHPQIHTFARETSAAVQVGYIQNAPGWTYGHVIATLSLPIGLFMWLTLAKLLREKSSWLAGIGSALTVAGYIFLGAAFGAGMAQGAIGTLPADQAIPPLQTLMNLAGPMKILYLEMLGLIGPMVLAIGLLIKRVLPRWTSVLLFVSNLFFLIFMDIDGIMFFGALSFLVALAPLAFKLIRGEVKTREAHTVSVRG